jgi:hypothetical protein
MKRVWITGADVVIEARGTMRRGTVKSASADARTLVLEFDGWIGDWQGLLQVQERDGIFRDVLTHEFVNLREPPTRPTFAAAPAPPSQPLALAVGDAVGDAARRLGALGGAIGGPARAAAVSPERRSQIAREAAHARWGTASVSDGGAPSRPRVIEMHPGNGSSRFHDNRVPVDIGSPRTNGPTGPERSKPLTFTLGEKLMLQATAKVPMPPDSEPRAARKDTRTAARSDVARARARAEKVFVFVRDYIKSKGHGPRLSEIVKGTGIKPFNVSQYIRWLHEDKRISYEGIDYSTMTLDMSKWKPRTKVLRTRAKTTAPKAEPKAAAHAPKPVVAPAPAPPPQKTKGAKLPLHHGNVARAEKHKDALVRMIRDYRREHGVGPRGPELAKLTGFNQSRISAYMKDLREEGRISYAGTDYRSTRVIRRPHRGKGKGWMKELPAEERTKKALAMNAARWGKTPPATALLSSAAPLVTTALAPITRGHLVTQIIPSTPLRNLREQLIGLREQWALQLGALVALTVVLEGKDAQTKPSESPVGSTALPVPPGPVTEQMLGLRKDWQDRIDALDKVIEGLGLRIAVGDG